jgi:hypothetical protein
LDKSKSETIVSNQKKLTLQYIQNKKQDFVDDVRELNDHLRYLVDKEIKLENICEDEGDIEKQTFY